MGKARSKAEEKKHINISVEEHIGKVNFADANV